MIPMKQLSLLAAAMLGAGMPAVGREPPAPLVAGLKNPVSVAVGPGGKIYVSVVGEFDTPGDGSVVQIENGKAVPVVTGLDDPKGLVAFGPWLFVADRDRVWR